jgi:pimeloyl-ACP methyl ester carboxylesterase
MEVFARAHQLVDVGGHKLNLYCSGSGSPIVVFESPSGDPGWAWAAVQPRVAAKTRACVYDRAGYGFSEPAARAPSADTAVSELHELLSAAGAKPPYVLVGNSLGGLLVQLYTYRYPAEVAGLVLAEPMHEDEVARIGKASQGNVARMEQEIAGMRAACAAEAAKGFREGSEAAQACLEANPAYSPALAKIDVDKRRQAVFWRTSMAETASFEADRAALGAARKPFGDLPLVVLARGVSPYAAPDKPQSAVNKATEDANLAMQAEVSKLSTRGTLRVVAGAGHEIQQDKPEAVVQAVDEVLAAARR